MVWSSDSSHPSCPRGSAPLSRTCLKCRPAAELRHSDRSICQSSGKESSPLTPDEEMWLTLLAHWFFPPLCSVTRCQAVRMCVEGGGGCWGMRPDWRISDERRCTTGAKTLWCAGVMQRFNILAWHHLGPAWGLQVSQGISRKLQILIRPSWFFSQWETKLGATVSSSTDITPAQRFRLTVRLQQARWDYWKTRWFLNKGT